MILAKVIGNVVATKKNESLVGNKLLIVKPLRCEAKKIRESDEIIVAIDSVGAGIGELVLIVIGSTASRITENSNAPVDAAVIGIVDDIDIIEGDEK